VEDIQQLTDQRKAGRSLRVTRKGSDQKLSIAIELSIRFRMIGGNIQPNSS
jgi:hypothetical protein